MRFISRTLLVVVLFCPITAAGQYHVDQELKSGISTVDDSAGLFRAGTIDAARKKLRELELETEVPTTVQTVESLKGSSIDEATATLARQKGANGIFILIAKRETKIEVLVSRKFDATLPKARQNAIRTAFVDRFRNKDFNGGLERGVEAISTALREAVVDGKPDGREAKPSPSSKDEIPSLVPKRPEADASKSDATQEASRNFGLVRNVGVGAGSLVVRNKAKLTLEGARSAIQGAEQMAESMKLKVNIWIVDDGGHPIAFERMEGARPGSVYTAMTKAISAATYRLPSGPMPVGTTQPDVLLNQSLQNAASASGGKFTPLFGGIPISVDDQVIGAVGVGGASGEQDATIAKAGVEHFRELLQSTENNAK